MFREDREANLGPTCSVIDLEFDYAQYPAPDGSISDLYDAARSKGQAWERFSKPLPTGNTFVHARGKECIVTAGPVSHNAARRLS